LVKDAGFCNGFGAVFRPLTKSARQAKNIEDPQLNLFCSVPVLGANSSRGLSYDSRQAFAAAMALCGAWCD
jgi:hypothetical protein